MAGNQNSGRAGLPYHIAMRIKRMGAMGVPPSEIARVLGVAPHVAKAVLRRLPRFALGRCLCGGLVELGTPCRACRLREMLEAK